MLFNFTGEQTGLLPGIQRKMRENEMRHTQEDTDYE